MQFNTYLFACFFTVVVAFHHGPWSWTVKKVALLVASYVFYAAWDPVFVVLLWASTVVDWHVAKRMMTATTRGRRKALLLVSLVFNLALLGYFKYTGLLVHTLGDVLGAFGIRWSPSAPSIVLPIGISFYTFMTISYTIDVYLERSRPARSFLDYALYVTFFPHLVSGPIVRATELVPQFEHERQATRDQFGWGLALLVLGLFEKVVVADAFLAPIVDKVYAATTHTTLDAWIGTLAFSGQIFCDFAGYSTCAIGAALCLGFYLPDNFLFPYAAVGFSDFWRRWHISLSSWLRDYLYIPLGGNRRGPTRTQINLIVTMLIGGLWHGASWTFVAWGALHGIYLAGERVVKRIVPASPVWSTTAMQFALGVLTFVLVCFAWVFFRARTFGQAFSMCGAMLGAGSGRMLSGITYALVPVAAILLVHVAMRERRLEHVVERAPWWACAASLWLMIISLFLFSDIDRAFIYFQF